MFRAINSSITVFFISITNVFSAVGHITKVADIYSEELELTAQLETTSNVHLLTKQLAALTAD